MKYLIRCFALYGLLMSMGCAPTIVHVEEEEPNEEAIETAAFEPTIPKEVVEAESLFIQEDKEYVVLNEPWGKYFRSKPSILIVPSLSEGIDELLRQEQYLIKSVLDSGGSASTSSEYIALEDKLEELKTIIPQAETGSGYVPQRSRRYGSRSYISGGTVYVNSRYYSGYYTVLREKTMSSSPDMTRSVEGIAHNATLQDLGQRIDALQQIQRTWNRKTAEMSPNGSSGIMRSANLAYLEGLQGFTKEFIGIRRELRALEQKQVAIQRNRASILSEWKKFEDNRLGILEDYLKTNAVYQTSSFGEGSYRLPSFEGQKLLYACQIGERTLYFDITSRHSDQHPFVLVDIEPVQ